MAKKEDPRVREKVLQAQAGHEAAFEWLFERFKGRVSRFVGAKMSDRRFTDAHRADVVQDTFIKAWRRINTLINPDVFGPWVLQIARRVIGDRHRRGKTGVLGGDDEDDDTFRVAAAPCLSPEDQMISRHQRDVLLNAISGLSLRQKEIVLRWTYHDQSLSRIADVMGWPLGAVRSSWHRAKSKLRETVSTEDLRYLVLSIRE